MSERIKEIAKFAGALAGVIVVGIETWEKIKAKES